MTMVELNEKALEQDRARLIHILVVHFHMLRTKAEEVAALFLHDKTLPAPEEVVFCPQCGWNSAMDGPALPAPDDGMEVVAWIGQGVIPISHAEMDALIDSRDGDAYLYTDALVRRPDAQAALQSQAEQITTLEQNTESLLEIIELWKARSEDAEQQVQKLTAESERLREAFKRLGKSDRQLVKDRSALAQGGER